MANLYRPVLPNGLDEIDAHLRIADHAASFAGKSAVESATAFSIAKRRIAGRRHSGMLLCRPQLETVVSGMPRDWLNAVTPPRL
jgi:hypothetical protein